MKKAVSLILALAMATTLLAGCGGSGSSSDSSTGTASGDTQSTDSAEATTFTVALDSDIVALDPAFAYDFTTNLVVLQITQGLLAFDENNELVPVLAKSWEATDDTTYVYQIRDDVTFSDGTPMTMDDVLFSLERTMNPDTGSYVQWMYSQVESIEQTGDWELTVHLSEPYAQFKYVFATTAGHIISKDYYEAHADNFGTAEGGILGTGAYVYDSWTSGQEIVLKKNENYWNTEKSPAIDEIVYKVIPEDTTIVTALQTGEVDFTANTPQDMLETLEADDSLEVTTIETRAVTLLAMNTERAPMNDVNVRKAIASAINLEDIQANIIKEAGQAGTCMPASSAMYGSDAEAWEDYVANAEYCSYDLEQAKAYMAASDYADGLDIDMVISDNSLRYSIALAIQDALKEININVNLVQVGGDEHTSYQSGEILDENGDRDYDMILCGWEADFPDLAGNIEPLYASYNAGEGGFNAAVLKNDKVDELLSVATTSLDDAERVQAMMDVMDIVNEEQPYINVFYPDKQFTMNKKFGGLTFNDSWTFNLFFENVTPAE